MFPNRYFPIRYFPTRYFPKLGPPVSRGPYRIAAVQCASLGMAVSVQILDRIPAVQVAAVGSVSVQVR